MTTGSKATGADRLLADKVATAAVAVGVVLLVLIGFAASYATLRDLAVSAGRFSPWLAPVVPLSFDLGIVVLSLKVVLTAKEGRTAIWLRLLVAGLSATTVVANASAAPTVVGRLLHAIPPAMFVICFESVTGSGRREALRLRGTYATLPSVQPALLLLAPVTTVRQWRHQVLHAQNSDARAAVNGRVHELVGGEFIPDEITSEPVARERSLRQRAVVGNHAGDRDGASRLRCAEAALRANPELTAAALADALWTRGHTCSVRTAQRVKAQALARILAGQTLGAEDAA